MSPAVATDVDQSALKTAFIIKMVSFIDWPKNAFDGEQKNFSFCLSQKTPIPDDLLNWSRSARLKSLPVKLINTYYHPESRSSCDLIFIRHNEHLRTEIQNATRHGVLTISDIPGNAHRGIIINFYQEGKNLRFEINLKKAREQKFSIQPRLLKLAKIVGAP